VSYRIEWRPTAVKAVENLPRDVARRVYKRVGDLADNPRPNGSEKLAGGENEYRVRVGAYRIIYSVQDAVLLVLVVRIGHRREVYRG
jgi:mRNA interferase RelE/StbE